LSAGCLASDAAAASAGGMSILCLCWGLAGRLRPNGPGSPFQGEPSSERRRPRGHTNVCLCFARNGFLFLCHQICCQPENRCLSALCPFIDTAQARSCDAVRGLGFIQIAIPAGQASKCKPSPLPVRIDPGAFVVFLGDPGDPGCWWAALADGARCSPGLR